MIDKLKIPVLNRIIIAGNLMKEPELFFTDNEIPTVRFAMEYAHSFKNKIGRSREKSCHIIVTAYSGLADSCVKYLTEGSSVIVRGELYNYQHKNDVGNYFNEVRIRAKYVQFLDKQKKIVSENVREEVASYN